MTGCDARRKLLEVCIDSVESAEAAAQGGADRIEACSDLAGGGLSPTPELFEAVRRRTALPARAMVRPRAGDFLYSDAEKEIMLCEARRWAASDADGIVCGALLADGSIDCGFLREAVRATPGKGHTLHRAFDLCADPEAALEQAIELGFDTILTSGQQATCAKGAALLAKLRTLARGRIAILGGAGIDAAAIPAIHAAAGIVQFHMSGKKTVQSGMAFRREGVPMGLPGMSEYERQATDAAKVAAAAEALRRL